MRIDGVVPKTWQQHVDHLGVADELHGDEPQRGVDLVLAHLVHVPLDRGEDEVVDLAHALEGGRDRVRLREIEPDPARRPADLLRGGLRAGLVPAGHDHLAAVVGVGLRELAAESLRAADDDDAAHTSLLSSRATKTRPRPLPTPRLPSPAAARLRRGCDSETRRAWRTSSRGRRRRAARCASRRCPATKTESTFDVSAKTTIVAIGIDHRRRVDRVDVQEDDVRLLASA